MDRWKKLRIRVTSAKKDAQEELEELSQDPTEWDTIPEYMTRVHTLDNVLVWMDEIEGTLAWRDSHPLPSPGEFSGPGIGEWDDLSTW